MKPKKVFFDGSTNQSSAVLRKAPAAPLCRRFPAEVLVPEGAAALGGMCLPVGPTRALFCCSRSHLNIPIPASLAEAGR